MPSRTVAVGVAEIIVLRPNYRRTIVSFQNLTAGQTIQVSDNASSPAHTLAQYDSLEFNKKDGDKPESGWYASASGASELAIYECIEDPPLHEPWHTIHRPVRRQSRRSIHAGGRGGRGNGGRGVGFPGPGGPHFPV